MSDDPEPELSADPPEIDPDGVVAALLLQSHVAQAPGDFT